MAPHCVVGWNKTQHRRSCPCALAWPGLGWAELGLAGLDWVWLVSTERSEFRGKFISWSVIGMEESHG